jgi:hypothetical protein
MGANVVLSLIAGGASLVAGIMTMVLARLRTDFDTPTKASPSGKRSSELKKTAKALGESVRIGARAKRRLWILVALSLVFFCDSVVLIVLEGGKIHERLQGWLYIGSIIFAGVMTVLVFSVVVMAYRTISHRQQSLELKMEQVHRQLVRR